MKLKLFASIFAAIMLTPTITHAKTRLIVNCFWPPKHFVCQDILPTWLDEVERVTEGRVVGNIPPKSVAPPPEQLASVEKGVVDAAVQFNGLIANRVSGPLVAMQPFVGVSDAEVMSQALWDTSQRFFPDEFDTVQLLSMWVISPGQLFSGTDTPITTVDEFKNRKMWALPGPLAAMSGSLGAGVVASPAVQSNEVIANGVVDSHIGLGGDAIASFQVIPYVKSMTKFSRAVYTTSFSFVINKDKWAEISSEDQAAIMAVSGAKIGTMAGAKWDDVGDKVFATFEENGIEIVDVEPSLEQAMVGAAKPITAKWLADAKAAGIDSQGALDFYKQRLVELSQ
ncbi:MAG: hypothetical protein ABJO09_10515 [Hyphomicrobiales bacterium]